MWGACWGMETAACHCYKVRRTVAGDREAGLYYAVFPTYHPAAFALPSTQDLWQETPHPRYEIAQAISKGVPLAIPSYGFGLLAGLEAEGVPDRVAAGVAGPPVVGTSTGFAAS